MGREGIGVLASCTTQCRYLTKHIVREYRKKKCRKHQSKGCRKIISVKEWDKVCSGDKMRKEKRGRI